MEEMRLGWLKNLLETEFSLIRVHFQVDSTGVNLKKELETLTEALNDREQITYGLIEVRKSEQVPDLDGIDDFLRCFWDTNSQVQIQDSLFGNFSCRNLKEVVVRIVDEISFESLYFSKRENVILESRLADVEKILLSVQNKSQVRSLVLEERNYPLNDEERNNLADLLDQVLPQFQNLSNLVLNINEFNKLDRERVEALNRHLRNGENNII